MPPKKKKAAAPAAPEKPRRSLSTEPDFEDFESHSGDDASVTPKSALQLAVGGRRWPMVTMPLCHVCTHPERELIEDGILQGLTAKPINESISEHLPKIPHKSLKNHREKHMVSTVAMQQIMAAEHARQLGVDIEETGSIITPMGILHEVMRQGFMLMSQGALEIKASDLLKAAQLVSEFEDGRSSDLDASAMMTAFMAFMDTAQNFIPQAQRAAFSEALSTHPIIKAMVRQQHAGPPDPSDLTAGELEAAMSGEIEWVDEDEGDIEEAELVDD